MRKSLVLFAGLLAFLTLSTMPSLAQDKKSEPMYRVVGSSTAKDGVAAPGEKVVFTTTVLEGKTPISGVPVQIHLHVEGKPVQDLKTESAAEGVTIEASRDTPGFIYFSASLVDKERQEQPRRWSIGVAVQPEKILPARPEPQDFAGFWDSQKRKLDDMPMKVLSEAVEPAGEDLKYAETVVCTRVRVDCPGVRQMFGYLTMPKGAAVGSLPARVIFPAAGIYAIKPDWESAATGLMTLSINIHGVEPDGTEAELLARLKTELYYTAQGWDDRLAVSFHGGFLRCLRALQYLKSLPQWDGKTLIASGVSQGGALALAMTGLDHDITFCYAGIPGLCNLSGPLENQSKGWPLNYNLGKPEVQQTVPYYDNCNFARHIKAPVQVAVGYRDWLCPPSNTWAAYNQIPGEKNIWIAPQMGHSPGHHAKQAMEAMLEHAGLARK